jgi:dCMP deaminase
MVYNVKDKFVDFFANIAEETAKLSYAKRLQVGAILVKDGRIQSIGYNGTPSGSDNKCENEDGRTTDDVIHAEENAILKMAKSNDSSDGSVLFVTHSPCIHCARLIYLAGISKVYYINDYRSNDGLDFLKKVKLDYTKVERSKLNEH